MREESARLEYKGLGGRGERPPQVGRKTTNNPTTPRTEDSPEKTRKGQHFRTLICIRDLTVTLYPS